MGIPLRLEPGAIPALCDRLGALLSEREADPVLCDLRGAVRPTAVTVEALARLRLVARRHGCRFQVLHACEELRELLALMGLEVLLLEPKGEAEQREQHGGVEEEGDAAEPIA